MISVELGREDLALSRFAISPLWETVTSLVALACPERQVIHRPWLAQARSRMSAADLHLLCVIAGTRPYIPDFLTPVPGQSACLDAELAAMCSTPADRVRRELEQAFLGRSLPVVLQPVFLNPVDGLRRIADQVRRYFELTLSEHWRAGSAALDADVTHRARQLAVRGPDEMLAGLHPLVSWTGTVLRSPSCDGDHVVSARGRGMLLVPSVFSWPDALVTIDPGTMPGLAYPPRGAASAWNGPRIQPREALRALLGATRATVLLVLTQPRSTTEVASRLNLSAATASHHLHVLTGAGLIRGRRQGRRVLYGLTGVGEKLIEAGL